MTKIKETRQGFVRFIQKYNNPDTGMIIRVYTLDGKHCIYYTKINI